MLEMLMQQVYGMGKAEKWTGPDRGEIKESDEQTKS